MIPFRSVLLNIMAYGDKRRNSLLIIVLLFVLLLAACRDVPSADLAEDDIVTPTVSVQDDTKAEPDGKEEPPVESDTGNLGKELPAGEVNLLPLKEVVLCMGSSPSSLFPYKDESLAAEALRHALYESLFTNVGYEYQAQGLERLPSFNNGDASIQVVSAGEGDRVVDNLGNIVSLLEGVTAINSNGEEVAFEGTAVEMEQMVVDFTLKPMFWSDGSPVTAEDSVFSFELAASESAYLTPAISHTAGYEATGDLTVRWIGLPGYRDQTYFTNVWLPLPSRQEVDDVSAEGSSIEMGLSSGPFVISELREDGSLVLERNPHYYRQEQGFPVVDRVVVRFGNGEDFLAGEQVEPCDVITNDALNSGNLPILETAAGMGDWDILTVPGVVFENIAFGVNPVIEYAERRPDWFEDSRVRQAMTMCTDRERMVEELTRGHGQVVHAYIAADHPLYPDDLDEWPYDPARANALLDEAGYLDFAEDGRRQDVSSGVPMTITLGTNSESPMRLQITQLMKENLADCGIPVETYDLPAGSWYASGPQGRLFGRSFDLASFAWLAQVLPDCGLYTSSNITGPEEFGFGGWQNINVTGWSNEAYDAACGNALKSLPGGDGYDEQQQEALRIFARELPAIPLFTNVKIAAIRPRILNAGLDSSQNSMLWNIYEWDVDE